MVGIITNLVDVATVLMDNEFNKQFLVPDTNKVDMFLLSKVFTNLNTNATLTDSQIEILKSTVSDLGVYTEYIEFGVDNGKPCIILGEHDSEFKVVITNTDIRFMEGSNIPAYISNQSLNIQKAVISQELKQGGFVWMARSNGNYGLLWRGE